jgi:hypothetical protein
LEKSVDENKYIFQAQSRAYKPADGDSAKITFAKMFKYILAKFLGYLDPMDRMYRNFSKKTRSLSGYQLNTRNFLMKEFTLIMSDKTSQPGRKAYASAKLMFFVARIANDQKYRIATDASYRESYEDLRFVATCITNYANNNEISDMSNIIEKIDAYLALLIAEYEKAVDVKNSASDKVIEGENALKIAKETIKTTTALYNRINYGYSWN